MSRVAKSQSAKSSYLPAIGGSKGMATANSNMDKNGKKKGEMTIAVSSNGQNVKKSVEWRNRLREFVNETWPDDNP